MTEENNFPKISAPAFLFKVLAGLAGGIVGTLILILMFILFSSISDPLAMAEGSRQTEVRNSMVKVAFGIMALVCLAAGFIVYLFAEQLGFSEDTAQIVAIAFLVAGAGDYLVLKLWDRIMPRR